MVQSLNLNTGNMQVSDIMTRNVLFARGKHSFTQMVRLFFELDVHHLPVLDENGELIGMISAADALAAYNYHLRDFTAATDDEVNRWIKVEDIMTPDPITIRIDASILTAATLFIENRIHALPVMEDGEVVGIITSNDLVKAFADHPLSFRA